MRCNVSNTFRKTNKFVYSNDNKIYDIRTGLRLLWQYAYSAIRLWITVFCSEKIQFVGTTWNGDIAISFWGLFEVAHLTCKLNSLTKCRTISISTIDNLLSSLFLFSRFLYRVSLFWLSVKFCRSNACHRTLELVFREVFVYFFNDFWNFSRKQISNFLDIFFFFWRRFLYLLEREVFFFKLCRKFVYSITKSTVIQVKYDCTNI